MAGPNTEGTMVKKKNRAVGQVHVPASNSFREDELIGGSNLQVASRRSRVAGHCFTNTESILNILKI